MVTQEQRHEYISVYRQGVESWRSKGNLVRETKSLTSLLMNCLAIAVLEFDGIVGARSWLLEQETHSVLSRCCETMQMLVAKIDAGEAPASTIAGNYPHLVFTHLAWAFGDRDLGEQFAEIAARSDVLELSTPFWQEYAIAVQRLIEGKSYTVGEIDVQGQEEYWLAYLRLIERATNNQDTAFAVTAINDAFARRNSDNTIKDDAHEIEGSGGHPIRWDFRRDGLVSYISSKG